MTVDRVMLLIDADNVSVDVIEQAVAWVGKHCGGPHVRRAYCTAESAVKHQQLFKRLSIRPRLRPTRQRLRRKRPLKLRRKRLLKLRRKRLLRPRRRRRLTPERSPRPGC